MIRKASSRDETEGCDMSKVILDEVLRSKLNGLNEQVEVCDETGRTVGHYVPADVYQKLQCVSIEFPFTEEEIARRRQEKGGRTLAEIWKSLGRT
jgi:hypothetical protein